MSEAEAEAETPLEQFVDDSPPETVARAKAMGWKDPSEWKGNPPKKGFVKASEYVERGESVIPIIKAQNAKLEQELADSRKELREYKASTEKTVAQMAKMTKVALDRQRQQLEDKYSSAIEAAAEVGDKDLVKKLRTQEREDLAKFDEAAEVKEERTERGKEVVNDTLPKEVQTTIGEWIGENPWYSQDPELQVLANAIHGKLLKEKPGLTLVENLAETRKQVAKRYPEKFGKQEDEEDEQEEASPRGSRVEGGSRMAGGGSRSKYSQLPAEAKVQCDKFIKEDGLFLEKGETAEKDLNKARERYAANYLEQN